MATDTNAAARKPSLVFVIVVSAIAFIMDALLLNAVFLSFLFALPQLLIALPLSLLKRNRHVRRHIHKKLGVFLVTLALVAVMVEVNAYVAPLRAERLISAIERYRREMGIYPQNLGELVPEFIDRVPRPQYSIACYFAYVNGGTEEPPTLFYNPHGMDHRIYRFRSKEWSYLD